MNIALIVLIIVVAISQGVSTALDFYVKKMTEEGKKVPTQVITAKEASDALYSEANKLLDLTGAEKKARAVQALLDQAKKENKPITESVAKGAVQHAYDQAKQEKEKVTLVEDETAKPIGFVSGDDQNEG